MTERQRQRDLRDNRTPSCAEVISPPPGARSSRLTLERLEDRRLLAATPQRLVDINPTGSSNPTGFVRVLNTVYFAADDGVHGQELWKSDGTAAGTSLVKDISPTGSSSPVSLVNVGGVLYFSANDGVNGTELWRSDGTAAGTVMVKDINPLGASSSPTSLVNVYGTLYFAANDGINGTELWKSDGTAAGTVMVEDIKPGPSGSNPASLTAVDTTLFFSADDGSHGQELWKSNGTESGTVLVKDITPGSGSSNPGFFNTFTNVSGVLYFSASDPAHGFELWRSDGTDSGTTLIKDINPGTAGSFPFVSANVNGILYFGANDGSHGFELWSSDGTTAGTALVADIDPAAGASSSPDNLTNVNGTLYFTATTTSTGRELYKFSGGVVSLVRDIVVGSTGAEPRDLTNVGGILYFTASTASGGRELWTTDGTWAGTVQVADINPQTASSNPSSLTNVNGNLVFAANDGTTGTELWFGRAPATSVAATRLFYNQSKYDGYTAGVSASDDSAIATDKTAYIPGAGTATFANISSYLNGINGVMIDIAGAHGNLTAADFTFRFGNNNSPSLWATAPPPSTISVRAGAGVGGSDRVELIWPNSTITQGWLEVIVAADLNTNLASPYAFCFGNAIGDTGEGNLTGAVTNSTDEILVRLNPAAIANNIPVTNLYDFTRDGKVDSTDVLIDRNFLTNLVIATKFISVGGSSWAPQGDPGDGGTSDGVASALASTSAAIPASVVAASPVPTATTLSTKSLEPAAVAAVFETLTRAERAAGAGRRSSTERSPDEAWHEALFGE